MAPYDTDGLEKLIPDDFTPLKDILKSVDNKNDRELVVSVFSGQKTKKQLQAAAGVSQRVVDKTRKRRQQFGLIGEPKKKVLKRQRLDLRKVEHFMAWLFDTNIFAEAAYGTSNILFDDGHKETLPKSVLTMIKARVIKLYHDFCYRSSFENPLSKSTCYRILVKLKPSQRKSMASMDNYLVECIEGYRCLNRLVDGLSVDNVEKKKILKKFELTEQYVRGGFINNCEITSKIKSHCISCGISDPKHPEFNKNCSKPHDLQCSHCVNTVESMEELKNLLENQSDSHQKQISLYDFDKAKEKVLNYMKHCMRSKQQRKSKDYCKEEVKKDSSKAFWIADWGQKVLPQRHRESMLQYFARAGMSIHGDCFLTYENSKWEISTYVSCIDKCEQTMKDVICVSDNVLAELAKDKPHIKSLYRKSDRAGCYTASG